MPNRKDLILDAYNISKFRYRELLNFCMQYEEKKNRIKEFCEISAIKYSGMPKGNEISDPTAEKADMLIGLKADIELIEQTAIEADAEVYKQLLENITKGISYLHLDVPYSRASFYRRRKKFFYLLSLKR
ncbi:MAG: hypothetical protein AB7E42_11615 [Anaerotignaceae bacterium]